MKQLKKFLFLLPLIVLAMSSCGAKRVPTRSSLQKDSLFIVAVNDMHAALDRIPRLAYIVDSLRAIHPNLILVSAGDNQSGNPINDAAQQKGWPIVRLMNELKFDVSATGNHEFDSRPRGFEYNSKHADFPFISGNFTMPDTLDIQVKPFHKEVMANGMSVGFVSVIEVSERSGIPSCHPDNVRGFKFTQPLEYAPSLLHYADSCDILVYLTHIGYEDDVRLAAMLPSSQVPLIIGGHSHDYVKDNEFHNGILVTQAQAKLSHASLIKMVVEGGKLTSISSSHITVGNKGNTSARIKKIVEEMNDSPYFNEVIAHMSQHLKDKEEVAYLMTDALRAMTKADIALLNGGGVRIQNLLAGDIRVKDVYSMDPFGNQAMTFKMTGYDIMELYKSALNTDSYLYVIPSGMHIRYTEKGGKITKIELLDTNNKPLDLAKTYTVSMNSYMPASMLFPKNDQGYDWNKTTAELMVQYLRDLKEVPSYSTVKRFTIIEE